MVLSPKLAAIIEQMERKGEQLFLLRRFEDDVRNNRHLADAVPLLNSAAARANYERKLQSMRLLTDLKRQMM